MENSNDETYYKLLLIKTRSKNFLSDTGRKTYNTAIEFLAKLRADEKFKDSEEAKKFINRNKNLLNN